MIRGDKVQCLLNIILVHLVVIYFGISNHDRKERFALVEEVIIAAWKKKHCASVGKVYSKKKPFVSSDCFHLPSDAVSIPPTPEPKSRIFPSIREKIPINYATHIKGPFFGLILLQ